MKINDNAIECFQQRLKYGDAEISLGNMDTGMDSLECVKDKGMKLGHWLMVN